MKWIQTGRRWKALALVEQIENPDVTPPVLTLPVELVVRASCGARARVAADG